MGQELATGIWVTILLTLFPFIEPIVMKLMWGDYTDENKRWSQVKRQSRKLRLKLNEEHVPAEVRERELSQKKRKKRKEIRRSVNRMVGMRVFDSQSNLLLNVADA